MSKFNYEIEYAPAIKARGLKLDFLRDNPVTLHHLKEFYKNHPVEFINDWVVTYNPQVTPSYLPFLLFPRQKQFIDFLHECNINREDGLGEKCREVGFTWLVISYAIWLFLFHPQKKISFGSRKEALVDSLGDPDSIFEKIRIALKFLPAEFLPKGFDLLKHAPFLKIFNPQNGSVITGEAGDNIGRGGRSTIYILDEAAFIERPQKVEAALSGNTDCKIYISTVNGVGNVFWQKRHSGKVKVFEFDWSDDPRKDQEWYDKKKSLLDSIIFAQEVLRDYGASVENVCIPAMWVKAAVNFNKDGLDDGKLYMGLDVADGGADKNAIFIRKGYKGLRVEDWREGNTSETAQKAYGIGMIEDIDALIYDSVGVGAGVKGELSNVKKSKGWDFSITGINTGLNSLPGYYIEQKKNQDMFVNLKALIWWNVRRRFEKTYAVVTGQRNYPVNELISIPSDSELINELAQPKYFHKDNGKIIIESKDQMRSRGIKSPNKADALMLAFTPSQFLNQEPNMRML